MILRDSIRRAWRSLGNAKGRTVLTSLAIAVGAFTLTLSLAAGEGARQYTNKLIQSNIDPQSLFVVKDPSLVGGNPGSSGLQEYSANTAQSGGATFKALTQKDIDTIAANPDVKSVAPDYSVSVQYVTFQGTKTKYTSDVVAYDSSLRSETAAGTLPAIGAQIPDNGAVIPENYAEKIGQSPQDLIGKTVTLRVVRPTKQPSQKEIQQVLLTEGATGLEKRYAPTTQDTTLRIVAVSAKSSTALIASSGVHISQNEAKKLSEFSTKGTDQYQKYITATAIVKDGIDPAVAKTELEKNGVVVKTAKDLQALLFTIVNILQGIVIGFGVIALIASVFGIINTQYISVLERTREIGLMKALGMRGRHVSRLFQLEAAWIGFLGGILGAGLAWGVGAALNPWISDKLSLGDSRILIFQLLPIIALIVALMLIAMLAGWFPARKASKLDPIEALRTE